MYTFVRQQSSLVGCEPSRCRVVVAIPVRNEANWIARCLVALAAQQREDGQPLDRSLFRVVLLVNNSTDGTWEALARLLPTLDLQVHVLDGILSPGYDHAGGARTALHRYLCRTVTRLQTLVLMTDADTVVEPTWALHALATFGSGCDAVAGTIRLNPAERAALPPALRRREAMERHYGSLLDEIDWRLDPLPHNPWPTHRICSGANLGITLPALRAISHVDLPRSGEDRAMVAALRRQDWRVRHDPAWCVETSARLVGRAAGGMADTLRARADDGRLPCDAMFDFAQIAAHRANVRRQARLVFDSGATQSAFTWSTAFGLGDGAIQAAPDLTYFGATWDWLEQYHPELRRTPLMPWHLPGEIRSAAAILSRLSPRIPSEPSKAAA